MRKSCLCVYNHSTMLVCPPPDGAATSGLPHPPQVVLQSGERLDYGLCVWSCGNAARPLIQTLVSQIPEQVCGGGGRRSCPRDLDPGSEIFIQERVERGMLGPTEGAGMGISEEG